MNTFVKDYLAVDDADEEIIEYLTSMAADLDTSIEGFQETLFGFFPAVEDKAGIAASIAEVIQRVRAGEDGDEKEAAPHISASTIEPPAASSSTSTPPASFLWKCQRCTFDNSVESSKEKLVCSMCGYEGQATNLVPSTTMPAAPQQSALDPSQELQAAETHSNHGDNSIDHSSTSGGAVAEEAKSAREKSGGKMNGECGKPNGKGKKAKGAKGKGGKGASEQQPAKEDELSRGIQNSSGDGSSDLSSSCKGKKGKGAKGKGAPKGKGTKGSPKEQPLEEEEPLQEVPTPNEPEVIVEVPIPIEPEAVTTSEVLGLQHNNEEEFPSIQSLNAQRGKGSARLIEWTCTVCTFTHAELLEACEMCCTPRPPEQLGDPIARPAVPAKSFKQAPQKVRRKPADSAQVNASTATKGASSQDISPEDDAALILQKNSDIISNVKNVRKVLEKEQLLELDTLVLMTAADFKEIGLSVSDSNALVDAVQEELKVRDLKQPHEDLEVLQATTGAGNAKGGSKDGDEADTRMRNDISTLMELLPSDAGLDQQHVEYVYRALCMRRLDEASRYLVENFVIDTGASTFRRDAAVHKLAEDCAKWMAEQRAAQLRQQQEEAGQNDDDYKKGLLDRYFDRPDDSKVVHRPVIAWDDPSKKPKGKSTHYRYVDGVRVAMKSAKDKVLVETLAPEWDGGSRGKVTTKGKRGPGFR